MSSLAPAPSARLRPVPRPSAGLRAAADAGTCGDSASAGPLPVKVLVCEDDWLIASSIENVLAEAGFAVVGIAADADEALLLLRRERPDLVLMDIQLQNGTNGIDLARQLFDRFALRSLFVSGNVNDAARLTAAPAQPLGWLHKPFSDDELAAAVRAAAGRDDDRH
ncbi:response regulator [Caenispirillum bisanense]|uniref:response regulator n=1 Tax=Caenispirillum bisanense TaxID=414052 RepID=UPI0031CFB09C